MSTLRPAQEIRTRRCQPVAALWDALSALSALTAVTAPTAVITLAALVASAAFSPPASATDALTECRVPGIRNSVMCGVVQRALDPAKPAGLMIDVHYVVVPAMARRKLPDPVFMLAGGPGQSAIGVAPQTLGLFSRLNNRRDIVFVDQRGTGKSAPLNCADTRREPLAEQSDPKRQLLQIDACRAALLRLPYIKAPADLGLFTTTLAMQDLDAVRRQLGAAQVNLVGVSYGTRAALEYQRQFPAQVRRSVLDAVAPPDMALPASFSTDGQAALDGWLAACEQQAACALDHPTLRADWHALLQKLPLAVTAAHPLTGAPEHFTLTREMVLAAVRSTLYVPSIAAGLPAAIVEAARGRLAPLLGLNALLASRRGVQLAMGMHFSVVCAEDMPRVAQAKDSPGADFGSNSAKLYTQVCANWPQGDVPAAFYSVAPSKSAALLLSGGLDPATPPRHAERVARALGPNAVHVVVANAGHGVMAIGCARDVIYRFIDAADDADAVAVDASCLKAIPRPLAFQPLTSDAVGTPPR